MKLTIKEARINAIPITLEIQPNETIKHLKELISQTERLSIEQQILIFDGKLLEDDKTLEYYNIKNDSMIQLVVKRIKHGPPSILFTVHKRYISVEPSIQTHQYFSATSKISIPKIVPIENEWPSNKSIVVGLNVAMFEQLVENYKDDTESLNPSAIHYLNEGLYIHVERLKSDATWSCYVNFLKKEITGNKLFVADFEKNTISFIPSEGTFKVGCIYRVTIHGKGLEDRGLTFEFKVKDDVSDLYLFLSSIGLEKYFDILEREEFDLESLKLVTEEDLKYLGIPMGPRKKLLNYCK